MYCSIGALPLWMIPVHAGCQRVLTAIRPDLGVQVGALVAAGVVNVIYAVVLAAWLAAFRPVTRADILGDIAFVAISVNAMAFFYFQFLNMSLTSIHMSVLFRVFWAGSLPRDRLLSQYDERHMVEERLRRLAQLKQVEVRDGAVHLVSRTMIILAIPIYLWRRLLGLSADTGRQ